MYSGSSLTEDNGSLDAAVETLSVDDKMEIVTECWVEPVDGAAVNCTAELSHFNDCCYSRIPDIVSQASLLSFCFCSYIFGFVLSDSFLELSL